MALWLLAIIWALRLNEGCITPSFTFFRFLEMKMFEKIISGGQTGVDRAALDVALELGIPLGGWCSGSG